MGRRKERAVRAELIRRLGMEGQCLRDAASEMRISFDRAAYFRKKVRAKGLLSLSGYGTYEITQEGRDFVARWGTRETSQSAPDEISEDVEEKLSASWKRILRALRKLREDGDGGT